MNYGWWNAFPSHSYTLHTLKVRQQSSWKVMFSPAFVFHRGSGLISLVPGSFWVDIPWGEYWADYSGVCLGGQYPGVNTHGVKYPGGLAPRRISTQGMSTHIWAWDLLRWVLAIPTTDTKTFAVGKWMVHILLECFLLCYKCQKKK